MDRPDDPYEQTVEFTDTSETDQTRERQEEAGEPILVLIAHPEPGVLGKRFYLKRDGTIEVGRSAECTLSFPDAPSMSRVHARIHDTADGVFVEDLGSTNGSFVNHRRVADRFFLSSGDRLQLGGIHFKFLRERDVEHAYYATLRQLALQDGLTEIANKRRFDDELNREFARAGRYGRSFSLILFDIDDFKSVNDSHGHLCGDFVLQRIAKMASRYMRREAILARIGGDEFGVLNPEMSSEGATTLAEKLRSIIADEDFAPDFVQGHLRITCSFGVVELDSDMATPDELFHVADTCLYQSKREGANRVTTHS